MGKDLPSIVGQKFGPNSYVQLGLSPWNSVVVPVVVMTPSEIKCIGSAFNVSPAGLWITAGHVIDEALDVVAETADSQLAIVWIGSGDGHDVPDLLGGPVPVIYYQRDHASDLGMMRTNLLTDGEPYALPFLRLGAGMRKAQEPIAALGYTRFEVKSEIVGVDLRKTIVEQGFYVSTGHITRNYPEGRDSLMLPTACFETSARFNGGMSGGPVVDGESIACGVVSSGGVGPDEENPGYVSFASATPHIFMLELREGSQSQRVYDMVTQGIVSSDKYFSHLKLIETDDGQIGIEFPIEGSRLDQ
ncbi:S1 family peptidase [Mycobacterium asiaticum]|uniref:S1 family peptidase n=1 Tax=Mycobacterium asiaticum TaxID=1790 RepID=UPI0009BFAF98|nr:serine protease [Mycobacterium asiaticum]